MNSTIARSLATVIVSGGVVASALVLAPAASAGPIGECDPGTQKTSASQTGSNQVPVNSITGYNNGTTTDTVHITVTHSETRDSTTSGEITVGGAVAASVSAGISATDSASWDAGVTIDKEGVAPGASVTATYGFQTVDVYGSTTTCLSNGSWGEPTTWTANLAQSTYVAWQ